MLGNEEVLNYTTCFSFIFGSVLLKLTHTLA